MVPPPKGPRFVPRGPLLSLRSPFIPQGPLLSYWEGVWDTGRGRGHGDREGTQGQGRDMGTRRGHRGCPRSELPDYAAIVPVLLEHGLEKLPQHCGITPGTAG